MLTHDEFAYLHGYLSGAIKGAIEKIDSGITEILGLDGMRENLIRALDEIERVKKEGIFEVSHDRTDETE